MSTETSKAPYQRLFAVEIAGQLTKGLQERTGLTTFWTQQQLILWALYHQSEVNQYDLVKVTGSGKSSNGRNLERLGRGEVVRDANGNKKIIPGLNWVVTYRDPMDRRFQKARLTEEARVEMNKIVDRVIAQYEISPRN